MKTKTISIIILILALPSLLTLLMLCMFSFDYWLGSGGNLLKQFFDGTVNYKFFAIMTTTTLVFIGCLISFLMTNIKYGSKIDKLEEEQMAYWKAKEKYEAATKQFKEKFLKESV